MATTTPNFGWSVPTSTDLVKDGATAIETLGDSIDASLVDLKGGTSGQVLSKNSNTDMDFTWVSANATLTFNAQTGTSYTLVLTDANNKLVTCSNSSAITVTVPPSIFAAGDTINLQQIGTGQVTFAQGAGVTITSTGASSSAPKLRARYSASTIICTASNNFTIVGDLS
jgi:hypothetical protein